MREELTSIIGPFYAGKDKNGTIMLEYRPKTDQSTFVYCPMCKLELCKNGRLISDDNLGVKFCCKRCNCVSVWDFDTPTPVLLEHSIQTTRLYDYDYKNPDKYRKFSESTPSTNQVSNKEN